MTRYKQVLLLFLGLLVWQNASAQSGKWGLPESPNGNLAAAFLDAVNETDAALHQEFIEAYFAPTFKANFPMKMHLDQFQRMNKDLAGAEVNGVDMMMGATPLMHLTMRTPAGDYMKVELEIEPGASPRIAGLSVEESLDGPPPADLMITALMDAINAADAATHQQFIEAYFAPAFKNDLPMETHLAQLKQMHQDLAGADVAGAEVMAGPGGDEQVTLVLATKGGKQYRMAFDMQVITSPPRLLTLNVIEE